MSYHTDGNLLSILAFFIWIPIALYGTRRWPPAKAMAFLFFGGLLLLPEVVFFKPPGLPEFKKLDIILVWIFIGAAVFHRQRLKSAPKSWWFRVCVGLLVVGSIFTVFLNADGFRVGTRHVPGQVPYDAVHLAIIAMLTAVLPFYLGAAMFRSARDLRVLLTTIVVASLLYSPLQFIELRLSPQMNYWVYGFQQHSFLQTIRAGGYRPMVFMAHGLAVALFTALSVVAAAVLKKGKTRVLRFPAGWAMGYLWVVLFLSKSVASFLYTVMTVPLVFFASPRAQARVASILVLFLFFYPAARASGLLPVDEIRAFSEEHFGLEREVSLMFRLKNEAILLDRTLERPWFGWGGYCRACLFDPVTGEQRLESIRDGDWIIRLGDSGIVGFFGKFSLLLFPILALVRRLKYVPRASNRHLLAGLGLMVGFSTFDFIPNGDFTRVVFVLSGALWGSLTGILQQAAAVRRHRRLARIAEQKEKRAVVPATAVGTAALCALLFAAPAAAAIPDAVGGGFAGAGIEGAYYTNPDLEGAPLFTRRDVRIDFDWEEMRGIGGSTAEPYRSFPRDRFSVRWSGQIIPRFSEAYTFEGEADDGVRIRVRAPGGSTWSTVVDRWDEAGAFESQPFMMHANELYDIQIEYREVEGSARCRLMWKSSSTPAEVIDPVRQQGINLSRYVWERYLWADLMKSVHYGQGADHIDKQGWPAASGVELVVSEREDPSDPEMSGTYLLRFKGQASVLQQCCDQPVFEAGGRTFERNLPKGAGYDASTNTTTSVMTLSGSRSLVIFDDTQRGPGHVGDGVSQIQLMRPIAQGNAEHHRQDEIAYRPFKRIVEHQFTVLRFIASPENVSEEWSERTLPDYAFFVGPMGQLNWEYMVMLANEAGSDLYITIPIGANDEYFEKLARLMRYGSDGQEPYGGPTADPVYPPLNPNLRLYVEADNEIWNWAFETTKAAARLTTAERDKGSEIWRSIDYDGEAGDPSGMKAIRRWHAVRTVRASNAFRRVWGDAAMGSRVRVLLEYQYDNYQDTALSSLDFIDGYYNNRSTTNVSDPHPVSYYVWGAGGAGYYGLENSTGQQSDTLFRDASFEETAIDAKTLRFRPSGTAWFFKGQAGLIRPEGEKHIEGLNNLPSPAAGKQAAFLLGKGSIGQEVRFAKPGTYAIAFNAAGSGEGWPGYQRFDILLDGRKVSPRDQVDYRVSHRTASIGGWSRSVNSLENNWGSAVFQIDEPGSHTVSFVARGEPVGYLLIDNVRIASADAIMTSGFHKGEALGQEAAPDLAYQLKAQAKYARAFGLQVVAYESGWSLGGDFGQVPLQNWCKLEDPRATDINDLAIRLWDQSGSFLTVWGVYKYWPTYDFSGAEGYAIMQSLHGATQRLRTEPTYGRSLPTTLRPDDSDWSHGKKTSESWWRRYIPWLDEPTEQWHAWMLTAPRTGTYTVHAYGGGTGRTTVEVDGEPIGEISTLERTVSAPLSVKLTKGAHALRVVMVGSRLELDRIEVSTD